MLRLAICFITQSFFCLAASIPAPISPKTVTTQQADKKNDTFKPFTGKILASKVRVRAKADLESTVVRQAQKNELFLVVGEEGDFWAIQPPKGTKAFVFRSYILDQVVEANRVNVRLEPHTDAPILAQLKSGDKVHGEVCSMNHKWLEIDPPQGSKFYISKELLENAGGPEHLSVMEKRKAHVEELLSSAFFLAEAECKKPFEEMSPQQAIDQFQTILRSFSDFPSITAQAKDGLALLKETYLQKKISYLEARAELSSQEKQELLARHEKDHQELFHNEHVTVDPNLWSKRTAPQVHATDRMSLWDTIEESLFLSWTAFHTSKKQDDFYQEQKANAKVLTGVIENYNYPMKNKPGDYILRGSDSPLAYLYSTHLDLAKYEGKEVTLLASPRPNHHFAFPAYFVLSIE